ncbi:MAG: hypothetical protein COY22_01365, partial [Candidatus Tagabacteria bacterium CG_4_10_14_0_2_um_filter_40_13]
DEIKKLGLLSRIKITSHESQELQKGLDAILGYVSKLGKALTKETEVSASSISNVFRKDELIKDESEIQKGAHIRVKRIL